MTHSNSRRGLARGWKGGTAYSIPRLAARMGSTRYSILILEGLCGLLSGARRVGTGDGSRRLGSVSEQMRMGVGGFRSEVGWWVVGGVVGGCRIGVWFGMDGEGCRREYGSREKESHDTCDWIRCCNLYSVQKLETVIEA